MARRLRPVIYSEVNSQFSLDTKKELFLAENGDAIADSLRNIILTFKGERVMNPSFGSRLHQLIFEPMDEDTAELIGQEILQTIEEEDPRVKIKRVLVTPDYDRNTYDVTIDFLIKQLPTNLNRLTLDLSGLY